MLSLMLMFFLTMVITTLKSPNVHKRVRTSRRWIIKDRCKSVTFTCRKILITTIINCCMSYSNACCFTFFSITYLDTLLRLDRHKRIHKLWCSYCWWLCRIWTYQEKKNFLVFMSTRKTLIIIIQLSFFKTPRFRSIHYYNRINKIFSTDDIRYHDPYICD